MKKRNIFSPFAKSFSNIRIFSKNSIFYYYCKLFLVVFLIPFFIFNTVMITYYYKNLSLRSEMSARQSFANTANAVENILSETESAYLTLLREPTMSAFLSSDTLQSMGYYFKSLPDLDEMADNYADISNTINSITIYSKANGYVLSRGSNGYISSFSSQPWYHTQKSDCQYYFLPNGDSFYLCYNVFANNEPIGIVIFDINPAALRAKQNGDLSIVLSDSQRKPFFSLNTIKEDNMRFGSKNDEKVFKKANSFYISSMMDSVYINIKVTEPGKYIVEVIIYVVFCLILTLVISFILAVIVSMKSYSTLDKILLEINDPDVPIDSESLNEINFITSSFMGMRKRNTSLQEELTTSAYALKQMQIEALQMQFNPHFLFNALNSLSMRLTKENGINSPYSSLIVLLSDILCESLNTTHYMVHISDEITYARKYLDFQKLADSYLFDTVWEVDESILDCYTVKLSMQPLIENAVKHGVKSLRNEEKGIISIKIFPDGERIVFLISNNSSRIDSSALSGINESLLKGDMPSSKNIGLKNVNKRIQLVFGEQYGCKVYSVEDIFTAELTIPKVKKL